MTDEPLMRLMKKYDIPLTRENYLRLAYMGEVPEQLSAEQEADLPVELQRTPRRATREGGDRRRKKGEGAGMKRREDGGVVEKKSGKKIY